AGSGDENLIGELRIVDVRSGAPAHDRTYPFLNPNAALLFTDGETAVFHDGSSGHKNLYLIDLQGGSEPERIVSSDLLREFHVLREGREIFVFTHTLGIQGLGSRLFRVDLDGKESLAYDFSLVAPVYARPLLTRHHVVVAGGGAKGAELRLYDREASIESRGPKAAFQATEGGPLLSRFELGAKGAARFPVPCAILLAGNELLVSSPFGNLRLSGPGAR
ncbi:MAG: TolB-like translocation protein, partial [Planctomycetota bacterium]